MRESHFGGSFMKRILVIMAAGLLAGACASANRGALRQASGGPARSFAAGDYADAIAVHRGRHEKDPGSGAILASYLDAVEDVKRAGDGARGQGDFAAAEAAYRAVLAGWDGISAFAAKLSFARDEIEAGLRGCRIALCEHRFREELRAGNHAEALAAFEPGFREYPEDIILRTVYAKRVNDVRAAGAKALAAKDYTLAGRINRLLLESLAAIEALGGPAEKTVMNTAELAGALQLCASGLANRGLVEYRRGNVEEAVAAWEGLLSFDPGNAEIKRAVETARAQLVQLKGSRASKGRGPEQQGTGKIKGD
jgi:tetratricopeptide (TPR) repeat protein